MHLYLAILIAVVVIILLLIKKSINSFPSTLVSTTTEEQYQLDEETQFTTEETQFSPNEIADGQYKISILYNWGYFKITEAGRSHLERPFVQMWRAILQLYR